MRESGLGGVSGNQSSASEERSFTASRPLGVLSKNAPTARSHRTWLDRYFYLGMSLLVAAVAVSGFSHTIGANLLHPDTRPPWILHIHALVFSGWVVLFVVQSALMRVSKPALHRRLGMFGAVMGSVLPVLGLATALVMRRLHDQ